MTTLSRYKDQPIDQVVLPDGRTVNALRFPDRNTPPILGFHRKTSFERLDTVSARYLKDPTGFWRLCDASQCVSPHALGARDLVAIPS